MTVTALGQRTAAFLLDAAASIPFIGNWSYGYVLGAGMIVGILRIPIRRNHWTGKMGVARAEPEIKRLRSIYASNREDLNREMLEVYKRNGVRPFYAFASVATTLAVFACFVLLHSGLQDSDSLSVWFPDSSPFAEAVGKTPGHSITVAAYGFDGSVAGEGTQNRAAAAISATVLLALIISRELSVQSCVSQQAKVPSGTKRERVLLKSTLYGSACYVLAPHYLVLLYAGIVTVDVALFGWLWIDCDGGVAVTSRPLDKVGERGQRRTAPRQPARTGERPASPRLTYRAWSTALVTPGTAWNRFAAVLALLAAMVSVVQVLRAVM